MKMQRMGRERKYHYHVIKHAWNAYLRMVSIDYKARFTCPICKDKPEVIIMDGVTMGTCKQLPEAFFEYDERHQYHGCRGNGISVPIPIPFP